MIEICIHLIMAFITNSQDSFFAQSLYLLYFNEEKSLYGKRSHIISGLALFTEFRNFLTYGFFSTFRIMKQCLDFSLEVASHDTRIQFIGYNIWIFFYISTVKHLFRLADFLWMIKTNSMTYFFGFLSAFIQCGSTLINLAMLCFVFLLWITKKI